MAIRTHVRYLEAAFDQQDLIDNAKRILADVKFDVIVATGVSGCVVGPLLAYAMGKRFAIARKPDDNGNHSSSRVEGQFERGDRWLFVDDLISTGTTYHRVQDAIEGVDREWGAGFKFVGSYLYVDRRFHASLPEWARPRS